MKKILLILSLVMVGFPLLAQKYSALADKSVLKWTGKKLTYGHHGTIRLKEGSFEIQNDRFVGGKFVVDMNTIINDDVEDASRNARLVGHLKSEDFFSVQKFPETVLEIKESTPLQNGKATVQADLTIKGTTKPLTFEVTQSGMTFSANVAFDRSDYDVRYGSDKFFDNLGDNAISNEITLDVTVVAMRQK